MRPTRARVTSTARLALKVPEITVLFWLVKLLTTAAGEAMSDYLVFDVNKYLAVVAGFVGLIAALGLQVAARKYIAWVYWLAVLMVAVFGTMAADVLHVVLGVPYVDSSTFFAFSLTLVFALWYASEQTLSIHSIFTLRRELFYWAAVVATFALGTATGDMAATTLGLGYFASIGLFAALLALSALVYRFLRLNTILTFWFAYVVTRPLGASIADWLGKPPQLGGIGFGLGRTTVCFLALIVACVAYLSATRVDVQRSALPAADGMAPDPRFLTRRTDPEET